MTDEEKEAVDKIKTLIQYLNKWKENITIVPDDVKYLVTVLNLIEKQSKEIEELKKKPIFLIKHIYSTKTKEINLQDVEGLIELGREEVRYKIKAKIEEIDKILERNLLVDSLRDYFEAQKEVLQSLLEKE